VGFFDKHKTGDILSRISSDTAVVQDGLGTNISMFTRSAVFIIISVAILNIISYKLTLITIGGILPVCLFSIYYAA
jgi:ATP-binding cassette, subfamily B (MDR/TAP), member 10